MGDSGRFCAVLFMDVAGSTALQRTLGEAQATRRILDLVAALGSCVQTHHGTVLKSDGDDVLALFERPGHCTADAAQAAIDAMQRARTAGARLYAGLHAGPILFQDVLGRADVSGLAVNFAARLHKLTPGVPGNLFLAAETALQLPQDLQSRVRPFGVRSLKGIGDIAVCTLDWDEQLTSAATLAVSRDAEPARLLTCAHAGAVQRLAPAEAPVLVGRSRSQCRMVVDDPAVSSRHLQLLQVDGRWCARDVSRNGTWLRERGSRDQSRLPGGETPLPREGALSLGRPFGADDDPACTLAFSILDA